MCPSSSIWSANLLSFAYSPPPLLPGSFSHYSSPSAFSLQDLKFFSVFFLSLYLSLFDSRFFLNYSSSLSRILSSVLLVTTNILGICKKFVSFHQTDSDKNYGSFFFFSSKNQYIFQKRTRVLFSLCTLKDSSIEGFFFIYLTSKIQNVFQRSFFYR